MKASIDQLQAFIALAETGNFTRASERLGISQSSLSTTVKQLEELLGVRLFDRHTRGCRLSEAGAGLLPWANRLAGDWRAMLDNAQEFASAGYGRLSIAAPSVQCALLLPPLLRVFSADRPGVRVTVLDVAEHQVPELVRSGVADLGIATQADKRSDLVAAPFFSDQYVVAIPPTHAIAARKYIEWKHLAGEPMIGPLPGNPVRRHLDERLAAIGIRLDYRYEVALPWTMVGMVREGLGLAVLTTAVRPLIEWHQLIARPVLRPSLTRTMVLLSAPGKTLSATALAFKKQLLASDGLPGKSLPASVVRPGRETPAPPPPSR